MDGDIGSGLAVAAEVVEGLSQSLPKVSDDELQRLRSLTAELISAISARQGYLATDIERFCDDPGPGRWDGLIFTVEELARETSRIFRILKREDGDFVIDGQRTYRELVMGLADRERLFGEIKAMSFPLSGQQIAYLREIAARYDRLRTGLFKIQGDIASYIKTKQTQEPLARTVEPIVVLVHGIRDFALWQNAIGQTLLKSGFRVEATNYGRVNLFQFLLPFSGARKKAIDAVWRQIKIVRANYPVSPISVIAHSFGTLVIARTMQENFDVRFDRVIFCGSVVPYFFPFEDFQNRFNAPIVNEVGTRDIWPALAESITVGYGSAGTYGFRRPLVRDRWHNGATHGYFLDPEFCTKYWVPFLQKGEIVVGATEPESPRPWLQTLSVFKFKYILAIVFACIIYWTVRRSISF